MNTAHHRDTAQPSQDHSSAPTPDAKGAGPLRWLLTLLLAAGVAAALGLLAAALTAPDGRWWLTFIVFTLCTSGPALGMAYFLIIGPTIIPDRHAEQSVERRWFEQAAAGAATDMVLTLGIALVALTFTSFELDAQPALFAVLGLLMVDVLVRYRVLSGREG